MKYTAIVTEYNEQKDKLITVKYTSFGSKQDALWSLVQFLNGLNKYVINLSIDQIIYESMGIEIDKNTLLFLRNESKTIREGYFWTVNPDVASIEFQQKLWMIPYFIEIIDYHEVTGGRTTRISEEIKSSPRLDEFVEFVFKNKTNFFDKGRRYPLDRHMLAYEIKEESS